MAITGQAAAVTLAGVITVTMIQDRAAVHKERNATYATVTETADTGAPFTINTIVTVRAYASIVTDRAGVRPMYLAPIVHRREATAARATENAHTVVAPASAAPAVATGINDTNGVRPQWYRFSVILNL